MSKKALVIGGGSDIGRAIIDRLKTDYSVYYTYNTFKPGLPDAEGFQLDLRSYEAIKDVFETVGNIDLVVTAAFPYINTALESFDDYLRMEKFLQGHVAIFTLAHSHLNHGGLLVNMLGQSADNGLPSAPHYGASFAYIDNLAKSYNARFGRTGQMKVFNLQLGPVETSLWSGVSTDERKYFENKVQAFIQPQQVAELVYTVAQMNVTPTKLVLDSFFSLPE